MAFYPPDAKRSGIRCKVLVRSVSRGSGVWLAARSKVMVVPSVASLDPDRDEGKGKGKAEGGVLVGRERPGDLNRH